MKHILTFLFVTFSALAVAINSDTTLMTIGEKNISLGEFEYLYKKNNQIATSESSSLEEYIDLFINFKLKVIAAEEAGYDTVPSFIKELSGYRDQLAEPYLKDQELTDQIIKEAYDRMKEEVECSHILIKINGNSPADSLAAYKKITEAREKILNGEDFSSVAKAYSQDPSAQNNGGYLGYFSGFRMVLPFENAAYNTPVGEISMPFVSDFGYHILKVQNRRASRGRVDVSHILVLCNDNMSEEVQAKKEQEINRLAKMMQDGISFEEVAYDYSEDHASAVDSGRIGYIRAGQTVPEFEDVAFGLKYINNTSAPFKSRFGWHIIKLNGKKGVEPFAEIEDDIKRRLMKDERGTKPERVFINRLKSEYNYQVNNEALEALYAFAQSSTIDSSFYEALKSYTQTVISYSDQHKTQYDFAQYALSKVPNSNDLKQQFHNFEKEMLIAYEKSRLEEKYEDFRYLMQEYHDGLLLFEISNEKIWGKASQDEEKLKKFYKKHKKDYRFTDSCYHANILLFKDSSIYNSYLDLKNTLDMKALKDTLNDKGFDFDDVTGYYKLGDNRVIDEIVYGVGNSSVKERYKVIINDGEWLVKGDIKPYEVTRGACISDYQDYLEKKWIKQLRKQHKVSINKEVLSLIE